MMRIRQSCLNCILCVLRSISFKVREHQKEVQCTLQIAGDRRTSLDFDPRFLRRRLPFLLGGAVGPLRRNAKNI